MTSDEGGAAAAEFAVVLPALVLVVLLGVGALTTSARIVRLQDAAADAARLVGRGDGDRAGAVIADAAPGAGMSIAGSGSLVCVTATASSGLPLVPDLSARACALADTP